MSQKWWVLLSVAFGTFMATLDTSIVNIALPTLTKALHSDLNQIKWVVILYFLVITCTLLPFGNISDQYGRKKVFCIGFFTFILGSGLCGFSTTLGFLLAARSIQGLGASMLMANGPALITSAFAPKERGGALGGLAMVVSLGLISGPSLGGLLVSEWNWPSIFFINIPIGFVGSLLAFTYVKKDPIEKIVEAPFSKNNFDWVGSALQCFVLLSLIVLFDPPHVSVSGSVPMSIPRWVLLTITLVFLSIFFKIETQVENPVFDLSLLKIRSFRTANLASFLIFVAYSAISVLMPFFLEEHQSLTTDMTGLIMTAIPFTILVIAPISGRLSDRFGSHELCTIGGVSLAVALFVMSGLFGAGLQKESSAHDVVLCLCLVGLGFGLFQSPNNNTIMGSVPNEKLGTASAVIATTRNLGLVVGTGLATTLFSWKHENTLDFVASLHFTFFISGLIGILAVLASLRSSKGPTWQQKPHRAVKSHK